MNGPSRSIEAPNDHAAAERCVEAYLERTEPRPAFQESLRAHVVQVYAAQLATSRQAPTRGWARSWMRAAAAVFVALSVASLGVGVAAGSAMPGDPLYLAKRGIESVTAAFVSPADQPAHLLDLARARLAELEVAAQRGLWAVVDDLGAEIVRLQREAAVAEADVADQVAAAILTLERVRSSAPHAARTGLDAYLAELRALLGAPRDGGAEPVTPDGSAPAADDRDMGGGGATGSPSAAPDDHTDDSTAGDGDPDTAPTPDPSVETCPPPGHGGTPPGQGGMPPGQCQDPSGEDGPPAPTQPPAGGGLTEPPEEASASCSPPGQDGTPPGQGETPPGKGGSQPGEDGTPPGHGGEAPGQCRKSP